MKSLRRRLMLWNALSLVALVGVFGAGVAWMNQIFARREFDRELLNQGRRLAHADGPPRHRPPFPEFTEGNRPDGPPELREPDAYRDVRRLIDVRRPRFFGAFAQPGEQKDSPWSEEGLAKGLAGKENLETVRNDGEVLRVLTVPLVTPEGDHGALQIAHELNDLDALWKSQWTVLGFMLPLAALAAAGSAVLLTRRALKPIRQMTHAAGEISLTDLSRRLDVAGEDEFAELAQTFNSMLERLERSFAELTKSYEDQKRFTADASHELRTPLTRLRLATSEALASAKTLEEMRTALTDADRAAYTMSKLVQQLLTLARSDAGQLGLLKEELDLRVVVADAIDRIPASERLSAQFPESPVLVKGDSEHLERVVTNLVQNALSHSGEDAPVRVRVWTKDKEVGFEVTDDGCGISPDHLPHLFDRFYRVDAARARREGGTGLGLAICKDLVEAHEGTITVQSQPGVGSVFAVSLPSAKR